MIPPAMTETEWASWLAFSARYKGNPHLIADAPAEIARQNAALPDSDPRKITWAMVDALAKPHTDSCSMWWLSDYPGAQMCDCGGDEHLLRIADALASYLPPRP